MGKLFHSHAADRASPLAITQGAVKQRYFNDLLTAIGKNLAPPLALEPIFRRPRARMAHQQQRGDWK
jgi:hypothetical protein